MNRRRRPVPAMFADVALAEPRLIHAEKAGDRPPAGGQAADSSYTRGPGIKALAEELRATRAAAAAEADTEVYGSLLGELVVPPRQPLILNRYDALGHTIIFGKGGSRKGTIVSGDLVTLSNEGERPLLLDCEYHPEEWQPRIHSLGGGLDANSNIWYWSPGASDYTGPRGPIWELVPHIRRMIDAHKATFLVIDSIQRAVKQDVSTGDTSVPEKYNDALMELGIPTVSLAHVAKNTVNLEYPFGSQAWHGNARCTWSIQLHTDGQSLMINQKRNGGRTMPPQLVEVIYQDGPEGLPLSIEYSNQHEIIADKLVRLLRTDHNRVATGPALLKTYNAQVEDGETAMIRQTLNKSLTRYAKAQPRLLVRRGDTWELKESSE